MRAFAIADFLELISQILRFNQRIRGYPELLPTPELDIQRFSIAVLPQRSRIIKRMLHDLFGKGKSAEPRSHSCCELTCQLRCK